MALKERYTVDDIILELEMGAEFGSESEDDFEGYLEEEVEENSSGDETRGFSIESRSSTICIDLSMHVHVVKD